MASSSRDCVAAGLAYKSADGNSSNARVAGSVSGRAAVSATHPATTPAVDTGFLNTPEPTVRTVEISRIGDPAIKRRSIARSVSGGTP